MAKPMQLHWRTAQSTVWLVKPNRQWSASLLVIQRPGGLETGHSLRLCISRMNSYRWIAQNTFSIILASGPSAMTAALAVSRIRPCVITPFTPMISSAIFRYSTPLPYSLREDTAEGKLGPVSDRTFPCSRNCVQECLDLPLDDAVWLFWIHCGKETLEKHAIKTIIATGISAAHIKCSAFAREDMCFGQRFGVILQNLMSRMLCPALLTYGLLPPLGFAASSLDRRHTSAHERWADIN